MSCISWGRATFRCRICGELGVPAYERAHACVHCWEQWEAQLSQQGGAMAAQRAHNAKVSGSIPGPATKPRLSFAQVCEQGMWWCAVCQRAVQVEFSDVGQPVCCLECGARSVVWVGPVPGYRAEVPA
jgi:hypothetical protein